MGFRQAIAGSSNNSGHSQDLAGLNTESSFALVDVELGMTLHSGSINHSHLDSQPPQLRECGELVFLLFLS